MMSVPPLLRIGKMNITKDESALDISAKSRWLAGTEIPLCFLVSGLCNCASFYLTMTLCSRTETQLQQ